MLKPSSRLALILLTLLIAGYVAFFTIQLILHYYTFGSRALDLGNMDQTLWNTLHGRLFHQTNQPGATNRLSLHVEPIFLPLSLLYLFYSGPEILFLFQSLIVALGALPVFALARLKLGSEALALVFAIVYLTFPAIQGATLLDFHAVTLAPTFLLAAFYALETRRPNYFALFAVLAVSCKEDMTLLIMMFGFYAFFVNRQYRLGLVTVVLSFVWAILAVFVIPPYFAGSQNIHWNRYGHLGDSPIDIVLNLFRQPQLYIDHLQRVNARQYLRLLLTPTAFTALLSPITLLLALPSLGINLLSNFPPMQRVNSLIYAAPVVPAVIISSIFGVANLRRLGTWITGQISLWPKRIGGQQLGQLAMQPARYLPMADRGRRPALFLLGSLILLASVTYHRQYGYLPGGGQFRGWPKITEHHRRATRIFEQIPAEAALSAQDRLNPHVSQRKTLYIFDRIEDADHIVLDVTEDSWPLHPLQLRQRVDRLLESEFGVVDAIDGYLLLAKDRPDLPTTLPAVFFDFARVPGPGNFRPGHEANITFENKLQLLGYELSLGAHEAALPVVTLYWRALKPLDHDYRLWPFFIDRHGHLIEDPSERPLVATIWYPTSAWATDEIIQTWTLPRDLGSEFTLAVGIAESDWADPDQRLTITQIDDELYTFENNTWARLGTFRRTDRNTYDAITPANVRHQPKPPAQFWNLITLQGADVPLSPLRPGQDLPITLFWQTNNPITVDLTTFAHLLDHNHNVVAQLDWEPQDALGYLPTSAWQPRRTVVDQQTIPLPDDLSPGQYRLVVGWYYGVTGDRLPLTSGGDGDMVELGVVNIQ